MCHRVRLMAAALELLHNISRPGSRPPAGAVERPPLGARVVASLREADPAAGYGSVRPVRGGGFVVAPRTACQACPRALRNRGQWPGEHREQSDPRRKCSCAFRGCPHTHRSSGSRRGVKRSPSRIGARGTAGSGAGLRFTECGETKARPRVLVRRGLATATSPSVAPVRRGRGGGVRSLTHPSRAVRRGSRGPRRTYHGVVLWNTSWGSLAWSLTWAGQLVSPPDPQ